MEPATHRIAGKRHFSATLERSVEVGEFYSPTPAELAAFPQRFEALPDESGETSSPPDLSALTIDAIKAKVESGEILATDALAAETAGKNRKTLVSWLEALVEEGESEDA